MHDADAIARRYLDAWNERHAPARRTQVAGLFAHDAAYRDPLMEGRGLDGIDAMIGAAQARFAGHRFVLRGAPDGHHDVVRFGWTLEDAAGAPVAHGLDIATVAPDGRLAGVTGFLDQA